MPKPNAIQAFLQSFGVQLTVIRKMAANAAKGALGIKDKEPAKPQSLERVITKDSVKVNLTPPKPFFRAGTWFEIKGSFFQLPGAGTSVLEPFDITAKFNQLIAKGLFEKDLTKVSEILCFIGDRQARTLIVYTYPIDNGSAWLEISGDEQGVLIRPGAFFDELNVDGAIVATLRSLEMFLSKPLPPPPKKPASIKQPAAVKVPKRRKGKIASVNKRKEKPDA